MQFWEVLLQGLFLGFSGVGIPLTIIIYCILYSAKNENKIGNFLFAGQFAAQTFLTIALLLSADLIIESSLTQILLNILNFSLCILFGVKLLSNELKNKLPLKNKSNAEPEYEDIYSYSDTFKKKEKLKSQSEFSNIKVFLFAFLFTIINVKWLLWFDISAKSLLIKSYYICGTSVTGMLGSIIFIFAFLFSEFLFYIVISKISSVIGKKLSPILLKILILISALIFIFYSIYVLIDTVKIILFIL